MEIKKPTTYEEQIDLLMRRGCVVENFDDAHRFLKSVSYQSGLCPQPKSARRSAVSLVSRPLRGAPR